MQGEQAKGGWMVDMVRVLGGRHGYGRIISIISQYGIYFAPAIQYYYKMQRQVGTNKNKKG